MGKTLRYGEFEFPRSGNGTYVKGYHRGGTVKLSKGGRAEPDVEKMACGGRFAGGGPIEKPIGNPVNLPPKPVIEKPADKGPKKLLGEQMGWPKKNEIGKNSYKQGGVIGKMPSLNPKSRMEQTPKKMNVKSRLSAGVTAVDSMSHGGKVKNCYAVGGLAMAHADAKADKKLIKKAVGMHDTQLHDGQKTNLTKLARGGRPMR